MGSSFVLLKKVSLPSLRMNIYPYFHLSFLWFYHFTEIIIYSGVYSGLIGVIGRKNSYSSPCFSVPPLSAMSSWALPMRRWNLFPHLWSLALWLALTNSMEWEWQCVDPKLDLKKPFVLLLALWEPSWATREQACWVMRCTGPCCSRSLQLTASQLTEMWVRSS